MFCKYILTKYGSYFALLMVPDDEQKFLITKKFIIVKYT